ncbi:hypothetical protein O0881_04545 [Janthinobacterium sp. SUN100]|uniref:hypothetical protein n=1 Tax=Janthinobacterium sp. SUN100 TaxID=3004101 RepID=UPI0025AF4CCC|nr:hypothetical protein [Janthinobacterium sp. SUN100]MDN2701265.1 hypothetical protein [Janthinobacterium sp. SUN100]
MKPTFSKFFFSVILIIIIGMLVHYLHLGYRNFQGYCSETNALISDEKKIDLAIIELFKYYPKTNSELRRRFDRNASPLSTEMAGENYPVPYKNISEFKDLNKNCCRVTQQPSDIEDARATLFDRAMGTKSSFVEIRYFILYIDSTGKRKMLQRETMYAITNCGIVWNGI